MRTLTTLILLSSLGLSAAQNSPTPLSTVTQAGAARTEKTGLVALPTPDGAYLRWYLPGDVLPKGGFLIQVTGTAGDRAISVAAPQPFTPALGLAREEYDAIVAIYAAPPTDDNSFERAIFNLNVVARPAYARALGIQTLLTGLKEGQYTATVYAVSGSTRTRVGGATFRTGPTPAVPVPGHLNVKGGAPARLTWTAPPPGGSHVVVGYNVFRATTGAFAKLEPAPFFISSGPGGDVFTDRTAQPGQTYRYQVQSVDLFGRESAPSAPVTLSAAANTPLPSPGISRATSGNRTVTLEWTRVTDPRVRAVLVLRGTTPDNLKVVATLAPATGTYVDTGVQGGVPYLYALAATDDTGQATGRSTLIPATGQNLTPPAAPKGLTVTPTETALQLAWAPNPEADLLGYRVYRSEGTQTRAQALLLTGLPITATTYVDAIPQGVQTRYQYHVVAVNTTQVDSAPSVAAAALLDTTPPPAPVLAPVAAGPTGLTLTWTQAEVPDLTGFEVIRATAEAQGAVLTTLGAAARTYQDTAATPGVTYSYSLRSLDRAGNRSQAAAPIRAALPAPAGLTLPTNLRATLLPGGAGVVVRWTAGAGPARYVVYRLAGAQPLQVSDLLSGLTFTDPQGQADSRYVLRALGSSGELSGPTQPVPVTP